jgi:hypothetical protein
MSDNDIRHPEVEVGLAGTNGNAFAVIAKARRALVDAGHASEAGAFITEATSGDYVHLLATCMRWVNVT